MRVQLRTLFYSKKNLQSRKGWSAAHFLVAV